MTGSADQTREEDLSYREPASCERGGGRRAVEAPVTQNQAPQTPQRDPIMVLAVVAIVGIIAIVGLVAFLIIMKTS
jgi:hypothetical protein